MVRLDELCVNASSSIAQKDLAGKKGIYPIYGASGFIQNVDFYKQSKPYIAIVKDGAGVGRVMRLPAESSIIGTMQYIIPKDNVDVDYLAYALESINLAKYYTGATIPHIYFKDYRQAQLPEYSFKEQIDIAKRLNRVSNLIFLRKQQLSEFDKLVKSQFIEMFEGKNYPYVELISLIKEGAGLSYGIVQPGNDGTGDMGVLRPVDIVDGKIVTDSIKYIDRNIGNKYRKTELTGRELLITVRGTTGITALADSRFSGMNVTRGIAVIKYNDLLVNPTYLSSYLQSDESQLYIQKRTQGAALKQINLSDLRIQKILLPPLTLQNEFAKFVKLIEKSKFEIQKSLEKLESLKKSLMQKYFG